MVPAAQNRPEPDLESPSYRPNTERMTISLPRGLPGLLRPICKELDLEYSKMFRRGLQMFIEAKHANKELSEDLYQDYLKFSR